MQENAATESKPETTTSPAGTPTPNAGENVSVNISQVAIGLAIGIIVCFFLPWINVLFVKLSGFELTQGKNSFPLLWAIPISCVLSILATISKQYQTMAAQLAGAIPFVFLGIGLFQDGQKLLQILEIGAYAGLSLGFILFILARKLK